MDHPNSGGRGQDRGVRACAAAEPIPRQRWSLDWVQGKISSLTPMKIIVSLDCGTPAYIGFTVSASRGKRPPGRDDCCRNRDFAGR